MSVTLQKWRYRSSMTTLECSFHSHCPSRCNNDISSSQHCFSSLHLNCTWWEGTVTKQCKQWKSMTLNNRHKSTLKKTLHSAHRCLSFWHKMNLVGIIDMKLIFYISVLFFIWHFNSAWDSKVFNNYRDIKFLIFCQVNITTEKKIRILKIITLLVLSSN